jgi:hypothetical protein
MFSATWNVEGRRRGVARHSTAVQRAGCAVQLTGQHRGKQAGAQASAAGVQVLVAGVDQNMSCG